MSSCPDMSVACVPRLQTLPALPPRSLAAPALWLPESQLRGAAGLPRGFLSPWLPNALLSVCGTKITGMGRGGLGRLS